ncbi:MAG: YmdB family metallophosphoesterase, partial [Reyranella sp.]|nr:YmdB family metallophosphoesterase [Reyranella sp.]
PLRDDQSAARTGGWGASLLQAERVQEWVWVHVMFLLVMDAVEDPFRALDAELDRYALGRTANFILVDVHGEATSEKQSVGHYCDGRVSAVLGSHSHVPTADGWVLPGGTAYQTDVGMCGDYDNVIGMEKEIAGQRFGRTMPGERLGPAEGEGTLCGAVVETDDRTGLARSIRPIRLGGRLTSAT